MGLNIFKKKNLAADRVHQQMEEQELEKAMPEKCNQTRILFLRS